MLTITVLRLLANAILSAEPSVDAIADRLSYVLDRKDRWVRSLALRYTASFPKKAVPRRREIIRFLRSDPGLAAAARHPYRPIRVARWITGSQAMRPATAAEGWTVPPITTIGALAEWMKVTPEEVQWFADLKGLNYKRPQDQLEHYHYRGLVKKSGSIRLIESPKPRLKGLQQKILSDILNRIPTHPAVHGFVRGRSIQSFAAPHVGNMLCCEWTWKTSSPAFREYEFKVFLEQPVIPSRLLMSLVVSPATLFPTERCGR
jgi:RNA-directed DNA polymerase